MNVVLNKEYLINNFYKLLPIYEGKIFDSEQLLPRDEAMSNFQKNLSMLILQINGLYSEYPQFNKLQDILLLLNSIKNIGDNDRDSVKKVVFFCIRFIKKMDFSQK